MKNPAKPSHRMPFMLQNCQDQSLRAANQKNSISGIIFICTG